LVQAGADPNAVDKDGVAPLYKAVAVNHPEQLQALLEAKADPNTTNRDGMTPLLLASNQGYYEIVRLLLESKADPNFPRPDGWTPLHTIVWQLRRSASSESQYPKMVEILKMLLAHKAGVNLRNDQGLTPLNFFGIPAKGTRTTDEQVIALLKQYGAIEELADLPPNSKVIRLWRQGLPVGREMWSKPTSGQNYFTLLETILSVYGHGISAVGPLTQISVAPRNVRAVDSEMSADPGLPLLKERSFDFPDFSRSTVRRLVDGKTYRKIEVNLLTNGLIDCSRDMVLEFGDVVEIPERKHAIGTLSEASRLGLDAMSGKGILVEMGQCLTRRAKLVVNGTTTELPVAPGWNRYLSQVLNTSIVLNTLPSTADFSRVKVTRKDRKTGKTDTSTLNELLFRDGKKPLSDDLLLEDGDIIEVPDLAKP
jgi:hypothetical protein